MERSRQAQYDALTVAMSRVITPVVICMAFAIWLANSLGDPTTCTPVADVKPTKLKPLEPLPTTTKKAPSGSTSSFGIYQALIFVGIFCVLIVVFTFLLVWLFKSGHVRFIAGWLFVAVAVIFAYVGGIYLYEFCRSHCINLDWVTLSFAVWNFTITGLAAVFWKVPRFINQAYLIVMSALMAFIFRTLPEWATWTILGVLVVWDLFAVLAPCGPLRMLVEASKKMNEPLPALVYDTNPNDIGRDPEAMPAVILTRKKKQDRGATSSDPAQTTEEAGRTGEEAVPGENGTPGESEETPSSTRSERRARRRAKKEAKKEAKNRDAAGTDGTQAETSGENASQPTQPQQPEEIRVGTLGAHLKLGLGDFVFYSVLVAQASKQGAMTAVISFVAILAGLCATLFLVIVYKKALPALPISIVSGMVFYALTRLTVKPFVLNLFPRLIFH